MRLNERNKYLTKNFAKKVEKMDVQVTFEELFRDLISGSVRREVASLSGELREIRESENRSYRLQFRLDELKQAQEKQQQEEKEKHQQQEKWQANVDAKLSRIFDMLCELKRDVNKKRPRPDADADIEEEKDEATLPKEDPWSNLFANITDVNDDEADSAPLSFELSDEEPQSLIKK